MRSLFINFPSNSTTMTDNSTLLAWFLLSQQPPNVIWSCTCTTFSYKSCDKILYNFLTQKNNFSQKPPSFLFIIHHFFPIKSISFFPLSNVSIISWSQLLSFVFLVSRFLSIALFFYSLVPYHILHVLWKSFIKTHLEISFYKHLPK